MSLRNFCDRIVIASSGVLLFPVALTRRFLPILHRVCTCLTIHERSLHHVLPRVPEAWRYSSRWSVAVELWSLGAGLASSQLYGLGAGAGLVAALSFLDDRKGLPVRVRPAGTSRGRRAARESESGFCRGSLCPGWQVLAGMAGICSACCSCLDD